jgi:endoglucanase
VIRAAAVVVALLAALALPVAAPAPAAASEDARVEVRGARLVAADGSPVTLRGVNWFGFETETHVVHGLWARSLESMIDQLAATGVNAVRLPVCPATLRGAAVRGVDFARNPELRGLDSLQTLDLVVRALAAAGLYVLVDHHSPDCRTISELWYTDAYTEAMWIDDLVAVALRFRDVPRFLGLDLKNEPHGRATWGTGASATDWDAAAERAAAAVLAAAPDALVFVQGIADSQHCSDPDGHWWGGNLGPLACAPLDIPADRLVLSPHVYGPDVAEMGYFEAASFPTNLPAIWERHFGRFAGGAAVVPGEWGGDYGRRDPSDRVWQDALVAWFASRGITSSFYWSWNPNSGDTGGVLDDDWVTLRDDKVALLHRAWGIVGSPGVRGLDHVCPAGALVDAGFVDVPDANVHRTAIDCLVQRNIARGVGGDSYAPAGTVTRAQVASMLGNALGAVDAPLLPSAPDAFDDDHGSVHEPAIDRLAAAGVLHGTGPRTFAPAAPVTRAQLATMVVAAAAFAASSLGDGPDAFDDDAGTVHERATDAAAGAGIVAGTGPRRFSPGLPLRRDQLASVLARALDLLVEAVVAVPG